MKPDRTIEILAKLKEIHEKNPDLYMTGTTNEEMVEAIGIGLEAVKTLMEMATFILQK